LPKGRSAEEGAVKPGPSFFACFLQDGIAGSSKKESGIPNPPVAGPAKMRDKPPKAEALAQDGTPTQRKERRKRESGFFFP